MAARGSAPSWFQCFTCEMTGEDLGYNAMVVFGSESSVRNPIVGIVISSDRGEKLIVKEISGCLVPQAFTCLLLSSRCQDIDSYFLCLVIE